MRIDGAEHHANVTSPVARRCLQYLSTRAYTEPGFLQKLDSGDFESEVPGITGLWNRLNASGLSLLIAAGPGRIFDLPPGSSFNKLLAGSPSESSLERQLDYVINNLHAILNEAPETEQQAERTPGWKLIALSLITVVIVAASIFTQPIYALLALIPLGFLIHLRYTSPQQRTLRYRNATVLYHYLLREFSEPVEEAHR